MPVLRPYRSRREIVSEEKGTLLSLALCGVIYQLTDNTEIFRAATASGGDLVEHFLDADDLPEPNNLN